MYDTATTPLLWCHHNLLKFKLTYTLQTYIYIKYKAGSLKVDSIQSKLIPTFNFNIQIMLKRINPELSLKTYFRGVVLLVLEYAS